ncbi:MAG: histidinol phosphate phosphatase domain-containing protein [Pseudomonadota bacterium]|uniref:Histidinol phosphate phosphatase domain-containing protein n=1 Tax=Candidatus Desulfatibia profunda TaxID=2841695 RepID=A0A8J6TIP3_9BACT|nr:histidinol phosphate phosphatase domain-containing protein [Candidatus Desulfatibia profunda]MBL7179061.1 histidinol phosphate phosphatase domain-containing protein [Desulfobacterales bacterium]
MIDLHTHSIFSDGVLIPSELARRAEFAGLRGLGITDHGDLSNIDFIIPRIVAIAQELNRVMNITVIAGIEITHVPPALIARTVQKARGLGAKIIVVHGETLAEPVAPGTNRTALEADIDVLAHPGLITEEEVYKAKEKGILLEISARKGHCLANGHVARLAQKVGAKLVINTDAHEPGDLIDQNKAKKIVCGAGLSERDFEQMQKNASVFL